MNFRTWLESTEIADVVHETGYHKDAEILLSQGVEPSFKRKIPVGEYAPGRGIDRDGLYVCYDKPENLGYGFIKLFLRVPRSNLKVSPELAQNGVTDLEEALNNHDGAVTTGKLGPEVFYKVEFHGKTYSPADYLKQRGLEKTPRLPSVPEYEKWLKANAERLHLQPHHIDSIAGDYERAGLADKVTHFSSMDRSL